MTLFIVLLQLKAFQWQESVIKTLHSKTGRSKASKYLLFLLLNIFIPNIFEFESLKLPLILSSPRASRYSMELTPLTLSSLRASRSSMELTPLTLSSPRASRSSMELTPLTLSSPRAIRSSMQLTPLTLSSSRASRSSMELTPLTLSSPRASRSSMELTPLTLNSPRESRSSMELTPLTLSSPRASRSLMGESRLGATDQGEPPRKWFSTTVDANGHSSHSIAPQTPSLPFPKPHKYTPQRHYSCCLGMDKNRGLLEGVTWQFEEENMKITLYMVKFLYYVIT